MIFHFFSFAGFRLFGSGLEKYGAPGMIDQNMRLQSGISSQYPVFGTRTYIAGDVIYLERELLDHYSAPQRR